MPIHMFTEAVNIGVHAILMLAANPGRRLSTPVIAGVLRVSPSHLAKVMQKLARARLVHSMRGTTGGFLLAMAPSEISLARVVDAVDPQTRFDSCMLRLPRCKTGTCPVSELREEVHRLIRDRFERLFIMDFEENLDRLRLPENH